MEAEQENDCTTCRYSKFYSAVLQVTNKHLALPMLHSSNSLFAVATLELAGIQAVGAVLLEPTNQ